MENKKTNTAIGFIFITMLIDITGWGIIIPVIPKLIEELIHGDISEAAKYGGWLSFAYAFTQFIFAPLVGNLSDKYGRRPIILISLLGFAIDYIFLALSPNIIWLFIGRVIAGITGASITTASAYIADISTEENRAKNFGLIGAAFGMGFIIGPVLGGLLGQFGSRVPFYAAAVLCLINFIYGYFILPESLDKDHRREFEWKRANPIGSLFMLKKHPKMSGLILVLILIYIGAHAVQSNWSYFTMYMFGWKEKEVGLSLGLIGLLVGLVQGLLIRWINPKIGNERSIYYGLGLYAVGMLLFAFATESWMMFAFLVPYCLGGICGPALQSVITGNVSKQEQGELQGALTSLMSATAIVGPPLMTNLFFYFTHDQAPFQFPGAPFFLAFIMLGMGALIAYFNFKKK
ncbi:TCR/Tet family MFS transporter [Elizabethkingia ursingii]|jgi:DHA1 family tetracycline resistance protein-like MFS transporter|uniref:Tetracycline resistance MFS efflux pump n=1 Tax=Elizabethkingia ursingii TaxID=1756150 RepID=A0AAJ3NFW9_9FLAO|nr:TCR/Tet family MFS transporter [Elizabethkingia ursingii]MDR2231180.1 TCR/Tet family MFS transporter [Flavobacteriaceae bacterium]AQX10615.1 tetracycline resistance MFS efflux pump [Elizabethkingia ursingii]KUY26412.1 MFS transporter [Elizabethkingia ursingii]MCL1672168.1 TCR/Tet family MFS transporter [Elizabethkingia ursingii]OPB80478.1 tetracycline resistance MFS efflux pump [Elizabethkingia ursingii]